jgi:hypothetical protein
MRYAVILLIGLWMAALPAQANGLHRCVDANGGPIFSDQPCENIGASVRPETAPASGAAGTGRLHAHTCAHTAEGLLRGFKIAVATGDVNQLSAFYHWPGIGNAEADEILKRLQQIAGRPIVSAELVLPHQSPNASGDPSLASAQTAEATAIELVQSRSGNDASPMHTTLALTQYLGCWWVHF